METLLECVFQSNKYHSKKYNIRVYKKYISKKLVLSQENIENWDKGTPLNINSCILREI